MDFSSPIISILLHLLVLVSLVYPINSLETSNYQLTNQTFRSKENFHMLKKMMATDLQQINKPAVKTIHSPDGDIIDCVLTHKQPAFDHPLLKGQKLLDPPQRPRGHNQMSNSSGIFQLWSLSGESCPEGTIPIRRTTGQDILKANSMSAFGKKLIDNNSHEKKTANTIVSMKFGWHSIGYVDEGGYKGVKATINVWNPRVESQEMSLAQIWIVSGSVGEDLNTIEAGWQVYPGLYGDSRTRFFIYWTADAYQRTGCYNLNCSGFVQTNNKIVIGGTSDPISTYNGQQYIFNLSIWKDPKSGNWWLDFGPGNILGYWPSSLFTHLKDGNADAIHFGGEIFNSKSTGSHTSTEMGSGHFAEEGYKKAAYFKNIQVLDLNNNVIASPDLKFYVQTPNCYNTQGGIDKGWGTYFFYGGPGRNGKCP